MRTCSDSVENNSVKRPNTKLSVAKNTAKIGKNF